MDEIIAGIIVAGAIVLTIKSFIKTYQGNKSCGCSTKGSCISKQSCHLDFRMLNKK